MEAEEAGDRPGNNMGALDVSHLGSCDIEDSFCRGRLAWPSNGMLLVILKHASNSAVPHRFPRLGSGSFVSTADRSVFRVT